MESFFRSFDCVNIVLGHFWSYDWRRYLGEIDRLSENLVRFPVFWSLVYLRLEIQSHYWQSSDDNGEHFVGDSNQ